MRWFSGAFTIIVLLRVTMFGVGLGWADDLTRTPPRTVSQEFQHYINNRPPIRKHHPWGVFLGTGWSKEDLEQIEEWREEGKWVNPFTGQPFDTVPVFVFGHENLVQEGLRIVSDHLEVHVLSSWEELEGLHFDFVICHSNGCTNAVDAHRQGVMQAEHFLALGTDWTSKHFRPGDLRGADITFFAMATDPIWKIPAPEWARIRDDTPGFKITVPFDSPTEIPRGMKNLLTQGRADPDRFPVIRLEPPPGRRAKPFKSLQPHALVDSYFESLKQWMQSPGPMQHDISKQIRQAEAALEEDDRKKAAPFPPDQGPPPPPACPGCGGGGGPGSGGSGLPGSPSTPRLDPRGGIAIDINIKPEDFQSR
jgi:hypothetical protein